MIKPNGVIHPSVLKENVPEFFNFLQQLFPFQDLQKYAIVQAYYHKNKFEDFKGHIYQAKFYSNDLFFILSFIDGVEEISEKGEDGYTTGKSEIVNHPPTIWFESGYRTALPGEKDKRVKTEWHSTWSEKSQQHINHLIVSGNMKQLKSKSDLDDDFYAICIPIRESELFEKFLQEKYPWNGNPFWRISNEEPESRMVSVSFEINFFGSHVNSFNLGAAWIKYLQENTPKEEKAHADKQFTCPKAEMIAKSLTLSGNDIRYDRSEYSLTGCKRTVQKALENDVLILFPWINGDRDLIEVRPGERAIGTCGAKVVYDFIKDAISIQKTPDDIAYVKTVIPHCTFPIYNSTGEHVVSIGITLHLSDL
jgi:hypothetical protein